MTGSLRMARTLRGVGSKQSGLAYFLSVPSDPVLRGQFETGSEMGCQSPPWPNQHSSDPGTPAGVWAQPRPAQCLGRVFATQVPSL